MNVIEALQAVITDPTLAARQVGVDAVEYRFHAGRWQWYDGAAWLSVGLPTFVPTLASGIML